MSELSEALKHARMTPSDAAAWEAFDAQVVRFEKEFGADYKGKGSEPIVVKLRALELTTLAAIPDHVRYNELAKKLSASPDPKMASLPAQVEQARAEEAKEAAGVEALKSKPLDLAYTSIDGKAVNLSQMQGKVVLIDFWATWCGPCVAEVPNVVAAYKKYHDQGFEIVGVSLDQQKDAVQAFIHQHDMTWPQYFDGKGWDNEIAKKFGIHSIPAMWLVGKDGKLITTNARGNLEEQIESALKKN